MYQTEQYKSVLDGVFSTKMGTRQLNEIMRNVLEGYHSMERRRKEQQCMILWSAWAGDFLMRMGIMLDSMKMILSRRNKVLGNIAMFVVLSKCIEWKLEQLEAANLNQWIIANRNEDCNTKTQGSNPLPLTNDYLINTKTTRGVKWWYHIQELSDKCTSSIFQKND